MVPLNVPPVGGGLGGQLRQNAVDLRLLLGLQLAYSLLACTTPIGSTNTVAPVEETSWTSPGRSALRDPP